MKSLIGPIWNPIKNSGWMGIYFTETVTNINKLDAVRES